MNTIWKEAVDLKGLWQWKGGKLWHVNASEPASAAPRGGKLQRSFVGKIYADQNNSNCVKKALAELIARLDESSVALNIGAGDTRYKCVVNLEIFDGAEVDIIGHDSDLPFHDATVDLVIMQEVLEHVPNFIELISEVRRVLKPNGVFYCQVPFQIGFHPGPKDYWRFTRQGIEQLFSAPNWEIEKLAISLGHGSGFYRIAVEFIAVTASCVWSRSYRPTKGLAALLLYPFKWLDLLTEFSAEKDRIPGGYFCIARKPPANEVIT